MPFRDLVGHRATLGLLSRAIAQGTLPPSLIFGGPEGVGKRHAAIALAQALNCLNPIVPARREGAPAPLPVDACGECPVCRRIARGQHPDVRLIEPGETGTIKIDEVREVIREGGYRPFEAKRRVSIFDGAEAIGEDGQNALLKTLEEPPASSVLVLVTSQPGALLPTVRSRCPVVRFAPLTPEQVATWLMTARHVPEARARDIAAVVRGSLRAAAAAVGEGIGGSFRAGAQRALELVADARDPRDRLAAAAAIVGKGKGTGASERDALAEHLHAMAALLRDLGVIATRADRNAVVNVDVRPALEALAPSFDHDRTVRAFDAVDRALAALERNASPKTVADWIVLQL